MPGFESRSSENFHAGRYSRLPAVRWWFNLYFLSIWYCHCQFWPLRQGAHMNVHQGLNPAGHFILIWWTSRISNPWTNEQVRAAIILPTFLSLKIGIDPAGDRTRDLPVYRPTLSRLSYVDFRILWYLYMWGLPSPVISWMSLQRPYLCRCDVIVKTNKTKLKRCYLKQPFAAP